MPGAKEEIQDPELPAASSTYADCARADGLSLRDERARSLKTIRTCAICGFAIKPEHAWMRSGRSWPSSDAISPSARTHMPGEFRKISKRKPIAGEPHIKALTCPI
jgi:hypothetical protein